MAPHGPRSQVMGKQRRQAALYSWVEARARATLRADAGRCFAACNGKRHDRGGRNHKLTGSAPLERPSLPRFLPNHQKQ